MASDHKTSGLSFEEAILLTSEPLAVFDAKADLRLVNPAFRDAARSLDGILSFGTPWSVFLSEAVRRDLMAESDAAALRMTEERLLDRSDGHPEATAQLSDGRTAQAILARTSDDGFVLSLRAELASDATDQSELEVIMTKVLQACPTCLTMSRIGDGGILYRSPAAKELLGNGFNSLEHFADRTERGDFLTELLPSARVDDMRITARSTDGRDFPAEISARLIEYRGEDVIVASIDDLSERLAAETEIERQEKQLFQLEKLSALGEVLSGIAHELNNPLSVVVGNAHLILEEEIDDDLRPRIEKMTTAAERCVRIVRTFLSMARDRPLELQSLRPSDIVQGAIDAFAASDLSAGINVSIDMNDDLPDLSVDEIQIVQVFVNILSNAAQALIVSGGERCIAIEVQTVKAGVQFRISDNGPGVPADIVDRIFDPLFTTKAAGDGTGLGLALCHRIVVAHGGHLELDADVVEGATFVLGLPSA